LIFVSAGTLDKPFNRLIEGVDRVADLISEEILAQIGHSTYLPRNCKYFRFCEYEEISSYIKSASMVISHAGFGIIGHSIKMMKPMVLVPRESRFGEAVDKQYELAEYLASQNKSIVCVRDIRRLAEAIESIRGVKAQYDYGTEIPDLIKRFISETFFQGK